LFSKITVQRGRLLFGRQAIAPGYVTTRYEMIEETWVRFAKISPSRACGPSPRLLRRSIFDLYVDDHFPDSRKS
jgi:hypothetical protein